MTTQTHPQIHERLMLHDLTRLEYGRLMWKNPKARERLLRHWNDHRHPYRNRFKIHQGAVERILTADPAQDDNLNQNLIAEETSLRAVIREIPPVFGSFYKDSNRPNP